MLCAKFGWNWPSGSGEEDFLILSMYFHYFVIISPWKRAGAHHMNKLDSPSPKDALCQVWLKLAQWFWRRRIFNFVNIFSQFHNYIPLEKGGTLLLNKLESPSPKDALCQVWLKLAQWFCRRRFFNFVNVFSLFRTYLPLEMGGPFIWTNLNSLLPRMLCSKFGWNRNSGSEEDF